MRTTIPFGPSSIAIGSHPSLTDLNSVFRSFMNEGASSRASWHHGLRAQMSQTDEAFELRAELPGVKREDIELNVLGDILTLSGTFGATEVSTESGERTEPMGLRAGKFERQFELAGPVDVQGIQAKHVDGVLHVRLPKAASAKPLRIEVQGDASKS